MVRRIIFPLIAWICLTCAGSAQALTFPVLTDRVVDEAGLISAADHTALDGTLADLEAKTGDQLVVVTLKSLQGTSIEDYGYQLGRHWGIGQKGKDSGVLLIVAPSERRIRIEVGYGLEGTLTDAATKMIIEDVILPKFRTGDLSGGIRDGAEEIVRMLEADTGEPRPGREQEPAKAPVWPGIVLGLAGVGLLIFCAVTRGAICRGILQFLFVLFLSGRNDSSRGNSSFSGGGGSFGGGGGSFGGGGSSGSW